MSNKKNKQKKKPRRRKIWEYRGVPFKSKGEREYAQKCDNYGIYWEYEMGQIHFTYKSNYNPDFRHLLRKRNGGVMWIEYKGYLDPRAKFKMQCVKRDNPDLDIRFVFEDARKPVGGTKMRKNGTRMSHAEWAEKWGYPWAEGFLPKAWRKELKLQNEAV